MHNTTAHTSHIQNRNTWVIVEYHNELWDNSESSHILVWATEKKSKNFCPSLYIKYIFALYIFAPFGRVTACWLMLFVFHVRLEIKFNLILTIVEFPSMTLWINHLQFTLHSCKFWTMKFKLSASIVKVGDDTLISVGYEVFKKHFTSFYKLFWEWWVLDVIRVTHF